VVRGTTLILANERTDELNLQKNTLHPAELQFIPGCSIIHDVIQDKKLNYWVCTDAGLFLLDKTLKILETITTKSFVNSLNTNYLDKAFIDRSECLWLCTFGNGVDFCDLNAKLFYTFQHNPEVSNTLSGNHIKSILEESGHIVWMGTSAEGLNEYDYHSKKFTVFNTTGNPIKLKSNEVDALELDNENNLWLGSDRGIDIINKQRNSLFKPTGSENFPVHSIQSFAKDCYGNMWFGSYYNGFGNITHDSHNNYRIKYCGSGSAYQVWADKQKPELMVSSINGLQRLIVDRMGNILKRFQYKVNDQSNSLSSDYIFPVKKQNDSAYWIGTIGGGLDYLTLHRDNSYRVKIYDGKYGVFNDVETLEIDEKGNVWMGGNGLERFDVRTEKLIRFDKNDGLQSNSFKVGASYKGNDGRLYFGGTNGVNYFFPDSIKINQIPAHPIFTGLIINNKDIQIDPSSAAENTIKSSIPYSKRIVLNYVQNNFIVSFSAMHYANSEKCQFRYQLVGLDKGWKYASGKNPTAAYTNLDYNKYTLILEATNNDGIWGADKAMLDIEITPPWWKSSFCKSYLYANCSFNPLRHLYLSGQMVQIEA
jgi:ligand-binding sensor domain-containing protein